MISLTNKTINLGVNKRGIENTDLFFKQHDNKVANFEFNILVDDVEIDYSQVEKALLIIYFQDGTTLEPMFCTVESDRITQCICSTMLSKVGTVDGILRLYSSDGQIMTTNSFRYTVDEDVFKDNTIEESISLLNQAMDRFVEIELVESTRVSGELTRESNELTRSSNENARISNEQSRQSNESERVSKEDIRISSEIDRTTAEDLRISHETSRVSNEDTRQTNETNRQSTFATLQSEFEALKLEAQTLIDELTSAQSGGW